METPPLSHPIYTPIRQHSSNFEQSNNQELNFLDFVLMILIIIIIIPPFIVNYFKEKKIEKINEEYIKTKRINEILIRKLKD